MIETVHFVFVSPKFTVQVFALLSWNELMVMEYYDGLYHLYQRLRVWLDWKYLDVRVGLSSKTCDELLFTE